MCELLFRGKRADNGEWVYGGVCQTESWTAIDVVNDYEGGMYEPPSCEVDDFEVVPESVGQFTGLTDINGTKIFEGDIIKHHNNCSAAEYAEDVGRVFYYGETSRFLRTSNLFPDDCPELYANREYEVIGNVYDAPNLLGGENEEKDII